MVSSEMRGYSCGPSTPIQTVSGKGVGLCVGVCARYLQPWLSSELNIKCLVSQCTDPIRSSFMGYVFCFWNRMPWQYGMLFFFLFSFMIWDNVYLEGIYRTIFLFYFWFSCLNDKMKEACFHIMFFSIIVYIVTVSFSFKAVCSFISPF